MPSHENAVADAVADIGADTGAAVAYMSALGMSDVLPGTRILPASVGTYRRTRSK
jgi:hypothetical protein